MSDAQHHRQPVSSTYASKAMHYASLNAQLDVLQKNVEELQQKLQVTTQQIPSFRKMGILHSSMFMSATRVINNQNEPKSDTHSSISA
ncbi:hypothetical protein K450DRAFT_230898 [Umbelopsis ramanniana AG]|uniref:Uncharacterized protein n=1 Tax=Umbelopsis ramanniana AG TaxID=1314678 RepID=A0AAD5HET2_UMBRA|nr:uncharacterized protein K450DRAFT_230898 [Umbelopsis ramanniana AG]KAI8581730.1 hypothetical protein K450DRAFT_230898 [Umbelopsis ramanniana AG]